MVYFSYNFKGDYFDTLHVRTTRVYTIDNENHVPEYENALYQSDENAGLQMINNTKKRNASHKL